MVVTDQVPFATTVCRVALVSIAAVPPSAEAATDQVRFATTASHAAPVFIAAVLPFVVVVTEQAPSATTVYHVALVYIVAVLPSAEGVMAQVHSAIMGCHVVPASLAAVAVSVDNFIVERSALNFVCYERFFKIRAGQMDSIGSTSTVRGIIHRASKCSCLTKYWLDSIAYFDGAAHLPKKERGRKGGDIGVKSFRNS